MYKRNLTLNNSASRLASDNPFDNLQDPVHPLRGVTNQPSFTVNSSSSNEQETYSGTYPYKQEPPAVLPGVHDGLGHAPQLTNHLVHNDLVAPLTLDRYPPLSSSRYTSSLSLASQFQNTYAKYPGNYRRISQSGSLVLSSQALNGLIKNVVDVSPFGGYPASSFPLHIDEKEDDDYLHNPDPVADAEYDRNRFIHDLKNMDGLSACSLVGIIILFIIAAGLFILLPVLTYSGFGSPKPLSYNILTHYSYPLSQSIRTSLIDPDTPPSAHTKTTRTGQTWTLTFSDEFNMEGRTFYEGDDQFFQAVDLYYDATKDLEWYDPDAITTANGTLVITLDAIKNHDLFYRSGMLQSWNKLCFSQGMIIISANLPGYGSVSGLWPGLWTLGNLARPGHLATSEGVWPYTYDSCDAGITANQSSPDGISYLPGQRLNACTCSGEDHPNMGTGRGAPEIDIVEATVDVEMNLGVVSQSYQIAPMDIWYMPDYNFIEIHNFEVSTMGKYAGGPVQQAVSCVSTLNNTWYELGPGANKFQEYGFEYLNNNDNGYITWYVGQDPTFTIHAYALGPSGNVGFRRISKEPMAIIMNLGISNSWVYIDWHALHFPFSMRVNYVRIYQPPNAISMTCDPPGAPTTEYIDSHLAAYMNVNFTSWEKAGYKFPRNRIVNKC
ncbi:beta-glucan synthesis-associated [Metschnikowia bicuspidata]|uniref:Beta-glucan synthesis-associated n=1 Tax=Metschnikowia bicuspidata TaxID=27322 RepID=A0A4P9ZH47_9ASCO|nr:beta-glucan synthesis-associated [Metschnikowia bicuspidata]